MSSVTSRYTSPRVTQIGYDSIRGFWSIWPWRTTNTVDGVLRVGLEPQGPGAFLAPLNPIGGDEDVFSRATYAAMTDPAFEPHPGTHVPLGVRVNWELLTDYEITEEGERMAAYRSHQPR